MKEWEKYCNAFKNDLDVWAVWQPGDPVEIFDYGYIDQNRWHKLGNLWNLIDKPTVELTEESNVADIQFGKASLSKIEHDTSVDILAKASLKIHFESENSLFLKANGTKTIKVNNLQFIKDKILDIFDSKWEKNWYLVSGIRHSEKFSVLLSNSNDSEISLSADIDKLENFISGKVQSQNDIKISGSVGFSIIGQSGPIHFDLVRFKKKFFSGELDIRNMGDSSLNSEMLIEKISPQDYDFI
jgi:hypothetical protein